MSVEGHCDTCKHFNITGTEWFYNIGNCTHPEPKMGGAMVAYKGIAEFLSCYQYQRKKTTKAEAKAAR